MQTTVDTKVEPSGVAAISQTRERLGFKEVVGRTGVSLHISETSANHAQSKAMHKEAGLDPIIYQNALLILMTDEKLKASLKGKWFYLSGEGIVKKGLFTINDKGELVEREGTVSAEKTVRVWPGKQPLSLGVDSDDYVALVDWRFALDANDGPSDVAPVVVGIAKPQAEQNPSTSASQAEAQVSETDAERLMKRFKGLPEGEQKAKIVALLRNALDEAERE